MSLETELKQWMLDDVSDPSDTDAAAGEKANTLNDILAKYFGLGGWTEVSSDDYTITYISGPGANNNIGVIDIASVDLTDKIRYNTRIRFKQGGSYKYGFIDISALNGSDTRLTIFTGNASGTPYAIANAAITDFAFSNIYSPEGFPMNSTDWSEELIMQEWAGDGSSNTCIPYFTNVFRNTIGNSFTSDNSSTLGLSITVNLSGRYFVKYLSSSNGSTPRNSGISLNSTNLNQDISNINNDDNRIGMGTNYTGTGFGKESSTNMCFNANDVIRPHTDGDNPSSPQFDYFIVSKDSRL